MIPRMVLLILLALVCSCSEGQGGKAKPPESAVPATTTQEGGTLALFQILPQEAVRGTVFYAVVQAGEQQRGVITWMINGTPVQETRAAQFKADDAVKGDIVQAVLKMNGNSVLSNSVTIKNSPPEIKTLKLMPENFKSGDVLSVEATAVDRDGDDVTVAYEWTKNGAVVGMEARMPGSVKRGDTVSVKLVPYDGITYGAPIVHDRVITNIPPNILEHADHTFNGSTYTYQVRATDADGDALNYKLDNAVDGMIIDSASGSLTWQVPANAPKKQTVNITVDDGHGGETRYTLNISIQ